MGLFLFRGPILWARTHEARRYRDIPFILHFDYPLSLIVPCIEYIIPPTNGLVLPLVRGVHGRGMKRSDIMDSRHTVPVNRALTVRVSGVWYTLRPINYDWSCRNTSHLLHGPRTSHGGHEYPVVHYGGHDIFPLVLRLISATSFGEKR